MKNKFLEFIILTILWALFYFGIRFLFSKIGIHLGAIFEGSVVTMLFISYSYKKWWSLKTFKSLKGFILLIFSVFLLLTASSYFFSLHDRCVKLYCYLVSENRRGWKGKISQADDSLGYRNVPGSNGLETFPIGESIPVAFDNAGFRIPLTDTLVLLNNTQKDLLFLGCSFTHGAACIAEETFPYLVAKETGTTYINAGTCAYGLSQMLILAEKLIPKYKPAYVIVQHSPWLVERSTNLFGPTYFGSVPTPYFYGEDSVQIHLPIYQTQMFNLDIEKIKKEHDLVFFFRQGLFYFFKEDWFLLSSKIKLYLGYYPHSTVDWFKAEKYAFSRICKIAKENHSKVIILKLCSGENSFKLKNFLSDYDIALANADSLLYENLKVSKSKNYNREYAHWRLSGTDSILIDGHPNPVMHKLISASIIPLIEKYYD